MINRKDKLVQAFLYFEESKGVYVLKCDFAKGGYFENAHQSLISEHQSLESGKKHFAKVLALYPNNEAPDVELYIDDLED